MDRWAKGENLENEQRAPEGDCPCLFKKVLLKISEIREGMTYKPEDSSGMRLSMGGRMSQNISDVFMTFFSFSDVLRTFADLTV